MSLLTLQDLISLQDSRKWGKDTPRDNILYLMRIYFLLHVDKHYIVLASV